MLRTQTDETRGKSRNAEENRGGRGNGDNENTESERWQTEGRRMRGREEWTDRGQGERETQFE